MPTLNERLDAAVAQVEADAAIMRQITHGDSSTIVTVTGGAVKSLAKVIADIELNAAQNGGGGLPSGFLTASGKIGIPLEFPVNGGEILLVDMPMDTDADANTFHGYIMRVGDKTLLKLTGKSDNSGNLSDVAAESEAFKLVDGGDQEATAFSLGFPAFRSVEINTNTTTSFTLPQGVMIREIIIKHTSGTGVDNIVASGLTVASTVSQNTFVPSFNMARNDTVILSPSNPFPITDSQGEALNISADTWHNSSVKVWVFYQYLP